MGSHSKPAQVSTLFDYDILEHEQRDIVQQRTHEIRERLKRSAQDVWEVGQKLSDVRSRLQFGQFLAWLKAEFGWSQRTAYNFINVYETFGDRFANLAKVDIATSVLYQLAAPSVPEELRSKILEAAEAGQPITNKALRDTIKQHKQAKQARKSAKPVATPDTTLPPKPEIITVIAQRAAVTPEQPSQLQGGATLQASEPLQASATTVTVQPMAVEREPLATTKTQIRIEAGWYQFAPHHHVFCGDTASKAFIDAVPSVKLAIAATSFDWAHDWLVDKASSVVVIQDNELTLNKFEQLLQLLSSPSDLVLFPWLPLAEMLAIAHRSGRQVYAGDPQRSRCQAAVAASGLAVKTPVAASMTVH
ncbi:MAG: DUF3102 domain-containing protein [Cyanobacteria bacterium P01_H01_bin.121]